MKEIQGARGMRLNQNLSAQEITNTGDDTDVTLRTQIVPVDNAQRDVPMDGPKTLKDTTDKIPYKRK